MLSEHVFVGLLMTQFFYSLFSSLVHVACLLHHVYITKCVHHNTCCAKACLTHLCYAIYSFTIQMAVPLGAPKRCVCMICVIIKDKSNNYRGHYRGLSIYY